MYRVGLLNVDWHTQSINRPKFSNDTLRDTFFNGLTKLFGGWSDNINVTIGDGINVTITLQRDGDISDLLRRNYAVLQFPSDEYRYYFARVTQDSGNQLNVELTLDDYTTNYNRAKSGAVAMIYRASKSNFDFGIDSVLNIPEDVQEQKYHKKRIPLNWVAIDSDGSISGVLPANLSDVLNNEIWVYYFVKPNAFMADFPTYKIKGVDTQHIVLCSPLNYKWVLLNQGQASINWNLDNLMTMLQNTITIPADINTTPDLLRLLQNSGLPAGVQQITTNLMPFVTNIKISGLGPFNDVTRAYADGDFRIQQDGSVLFTETLGRVQSVTRNSIPVACILEQNRNFNFGIKFDKTEKPTKFNSVDFLEYRLVNHKGDYFTFDFNKLNGGDLVVNMYEELTADTTDCFISMKSTTASIYDLNYKNYNGIVSNTDTGIPMFIDALSDYFAGNKNAVRSNELERQALIQSAELDTQRNSQRNRERWANPLSVLAGITSSFGGSEISTRMTIRNDNALIRRHANLNANKMKSQESLTYDNLQYSPPRVNGSGNVLFNHQIMGLLPVIDIYQVEDIVLDKYVLYFENFGYNFGMIYDLEELDNDTGNELYLQCDLLQTSANISNEELERLRQVLNGGVKRVVKK